MTNPLSREDAGADALPRHPIGAVARRTGLSTHVLRAWERRYALVEPWRDEHGVRLYSDADVVRLRLLKRATEGGNPIRRVAGLGVEELLALLRAAGDAPGVAPDRSLPPAAAAYVAAALEAVEAMDGPRIQSTLARAAVGLGLMDFVEGVAGPLLRHVGELWRSGDLCPAHEHLLSVCVRRALDRMLETLDPLPDAPRLLATTPAGQRHELGAMLAAVVAAGAGWRPLYLGPDLPAADIARAAASTRADAVALSLVHREERGTALEEVSALRSRLPGGVLLFAGGRAAAPHRERLEADGVTWLADLGAFREALRATGKGVEA